MPEMLDAAIEGSIKAMWICGYDIAQSDPDVDHVVAALSNLDFLVVQEIFENETSKFAHVILPAASFLEKSGTFTNAERRIQVVEAAATPPGAAKTDLEIYKLISASLGHELPYEGPEDVMAEIAELTPHFAGVTYERLGRRGLQWPVAADGTDSPILYADAFELPNGTAHFAALPYKPPGDEASERVPAHPRHRPAARALQRRHDDPAHRQPRAVLEGLARDPSRGRRAARDRSGDVVEVRSKHGRIEIEAHVTERIEPGHVFTAFHFPEVRTNLLVGPSADVNTSCPEYKVVAVAVDKTGVPAEVPDEVAVA